MSSCENQTLTCISPPPPQGPKVKQFMDIFSIPEMTLLAVANDFFITNDIEYDPVHLFKDVSVSYDMF